jgi:hypothetical protein
MEIEADLKKRLEHLSNLLYTLPENDRKFIDGALKRVMEEFYGKNPISNQLIGEISNKLVEAIREYSDLIKEVRSNVVADPKGLHSYKERFRKCVGEFEKSVKDYLESVEKLTKELQSKYKGYSEKIKEDPIKYVWALFSEANKLKSNKKYIAYGLSNSFAYLVKNSIMYRLITTNPGENAYASGAEFAEKEIIPLIASMLNKLEEFESVYKTIQDFSNSIIYGNSYRNKEKISSTHIYLLIIFGLIIGFLFLIGSKETTMAVLTTNNLTSFLAFGILVLAILLFFKFYKK